MGLGGRKDAHRAWKASPACLTACPSTRRCSPQAGQHSTVLLLGHRAFNNSTGAAHLPWAVAGRWVNRNVSLKERPSPLAVG
jgi:hypothetical protein